MATRRSGYRIEVTNAATKEAEVYLYGDIGAGFWSDGVDAAAFAKELAALDAKTIRVRINSGGGKVFEATAIAAAIRRHPANTVSHIDGLAASAASFVALAADEVRIAKGGHFMIHNARAGAMGEAKDLRATADVLDKLTGSIRETYVEKTGASEEEVAAWMDAETWFTAQEALDAGFVDAIDQVEAAKAEFDPTIYNHVPAELLERMSDPQQKIETVRDFEALLRDAGGFTRQQAKAIAASGFRATSEPRDEAGGLADIRSALTRRGQTIPSLSR